MAIKKLTFSFEVPITQLLGLIATGNSGLKIDVLGDDEPTPKALARNGVKLLEGPRKRQGHGPRHASNGQPSWLSILEALAKNPEHTKAISDLSAMLVTHGLSPKSVSPQVSAMQSKGFVSRVEPGIYRLTAKGLREAVQRGFSVAQSKPPPKKRPKKKKVAATAVAAEQDHG